jgi:hypothetical protein
MYGVGGTWKGWCCQSCGWNYPLPPSSNELDAAAREAKKLFDEHRCQDFGEPLWTKSDYKSASNLLSATAELLSGAKAAAGTPQATIRCFGNAGGG